MSDDNIEEMEEQYAARLARDVRVIKQNRPASQEMMSLLAENTWFKFDKLKKCGFTAEQAMELITKGVV